MGPLLYRASSRGASTLRRMDQKAHQLQQSASTLEFFLPMSDQPFCLSRYKHTFHADQSRPAQQLVITIRPRTSSLELSLVKVETSSRSRCPLHESSLAIQIHSYRPVRITLRI